MSDLVLRNVRPYGEDPVDVAITDGVISAIGVGLARIDAARRRVIDGRGLVLLPGLVDLHTHLREPGREDAETVETGSEAAALGGYTAVFAMPNTDPAADTAGVVEQIWRLGRETGPGGRPADRRRHRRAGPAPSWPNSAPWPIRPPTSGSSPTTARACPIRP